MLDTKITFVSFHILSLSSCFRLFGLPEIVISKCTPSNELTINEKLNWPVYVYPVVIFLVYWILATEVRYKCSRVCFLVFDHVFKLLASSYNCKADKEAYTTKNDVFKYILIANPCASQYIQFDFE